MKIVFERRPMNILGKGDYLHSIVRHFIAHFVALVFVVLGSGVARGAYCRITTRSWVDQNFEIRCPDKIGRTYGSSDAIDFNLFAGCAEYDTNIDDYGKFVVLYQDGSTTDCHNILGVSYGDANGNFTGCKSCNSDAKLVWTSDLVSRGIIGNCSRMIGGEGGRTCIKCTRSVGDWRDNGFYQVRVDEYVAGNICGEPEKHYRCAAGYYSGAGLDDATDLDDLDCRACMSLGGFSTTSPAGSKSRSDCCVGGSKTTNDGTGTLMVDGDCCWS